MPQMSPMWWTFMFIMFSLSLLLINMINYFEKNSKTEKKIKEKINKKMNWKW